MIVKQELKHADKCEEIHLRSDHIQSDQMATVLIQDPRKPAYSGFCFSVESFLGGLRK